MQSDFYVYVLFDQHGIPRYVGKGRGQRWLVHEKRRKDNHRLKDYFIRTTLAAIGCIPKVKVRENLPESEAFNVEGALIKAIGRYPNGPLTNLTDKRNGTTSELAKAWHASRTPEQRSATMRKAAKGRSSETMRANAMIVGSEALSQRMKAIRAKQTPEERREIGRRGGLASKAKRQQRLLYIQPFLFDKG